MDEVKPHFSAEIFVMPFVYKSEVLKSIYDKLVDDAVEDIVEFKSRFFVNPIQYLVNPIRYVCLRSRTEQVRQVPVVCNYNGHIVPQEIAYQLAAYELGEYDYSFERWARIKGILT